jgi:hypothetical protein
VECDGKKLLFRIVGMLDKWIVEGEVPLENWQSPNNELKNE